MTKPTESVVWLTPHIVGIALAFAAGGGVGWFAARGDVPVAPAAGSAAVPAAPNASAAARRGGELPPGHGPQAHVEIGLDALALGDYGEAVRNLDIAANEGMDLPQLSVFRAIAAEGAGDAAKAAALVAGDTERILLRDVAKKAWLEHQDVGIAGPAYQLYLRVVPAGRGPAEENRTMMERAVEVWRATPPPTP